MYCWLHVLVLWQVIGSAKAANMFKENISPNREMLEDIKLLFLVWLGVCVCGGEGNGMEWKMMHVNVGCANLDDNTSLKFIVKVSCQCNYSFIFYFHWCCRFCLFLLIIDLFSQLTPLFRSQRKINGLSFNQLLITSGILL